MKKIFTYFSLITFMLLSSQCKKTAIEKPVYGNQSNENFYKTDADISQALTSTYLQLRQTWNEFALEHYMIGDATTDDALKGGGDDGDRGDFQSLANFIVYPTNSEVGNTWSILYNLINRANEVITYGPAASGDKTLIARYINEAKLLRAFGYYNLVTLYGGAPLVLKPLTPSEATSTPRASAAAVYTQIITDLTDATGLPAKNEYSAADQYRVSKGLAYTLLGKTYMFQGDYNKAVTAFQTVVASGAYSLLPNYGDNW
ncbi:MAG: RagB/SusD family nutrient uptake outer membrane protein, partial [Mucilaginibacter sp.]